MSFANIKVIYRRTAVLLLFAVTICFSGCKTKKEKFVEYSFDFFDTVTTITGYETSEEVFDKNVALIEAELLKCHRLFNIYYDYDGMTNVKSLNAVKNGAHEALVVDPLLFDMLSFSEYVYHLTDGRTNIAMGSVLSIWHEAREFGEHNPAEAYVPDIELLKKAAVHTSFDNVTLSADTKQVFISDPEQTLDVGAVAKGYAIEHVAHFMEEKGITGYCLNIGGNVRPVGEKGDGSGNWAVGIENPLFDPDTDDKSNAYIAILDFSDRAIATSGSYQRFYTVDGRNYHHIIDPDTLMPENRWLSVSVISDDAGLSDALSTALFNMTLEEGKALAETLDNVEIVWLSSDGTVTMTDGVTDYLRK